MGKSVLIYHVEWFVRILIAAICGCCIGYERSSRNKGAGIRTHAILALGSALMVLISKYGFCDFKNIDGSNCKWCRFLRRWCYFCKTWNCFGTDYGSRNVGYFRSRNVYWMWIV